MRLSPSDRELARRLEAAESANMVALARAASASLPHAAFEPFAGGAAVFAGVGSPVTHAMGIGFSGDTSESELERMEQFFRERGSACLIDLCPLADPSVIEFVQSRHYRIVEFNNVLVRPVSRFESFESIPDSVRPIEKGEVYDWARVVSEGFSEHVPVVDETVETMAAMCSESHCWLAGEGQPVGGAAMGIRSDIALLYGDALLPAARRRGFQSALIRARLQAAQEAGCELAMVSVLPGSGSHRNYERAGFELIYMRVNLSREF